MSTRSSKRGNGKQVSHGSSTNNQKKKPDDEQRPGPLVLVLYTADKTRGVLLRTSINPTDAVKGSKCQAPVPDDAKSSSTETEENTKTYEAIVVEFGFNEEYLYGLNLLQDGTLATDEVDLQSEEIQKTLAKKRSAERTALRKEVADAEQELRAEILKLTPLVGKPQQGSPTITDMEMGSRSQQSEETITPTTKSSLNNPAPAPQISPASLVGLHINILLKQDKWNE